MKYEYEEKENFAIEQHQKLKAETLQELVQKHYHFFTKDCFCSQCKFDVCDHCWSYQRYGLGLKSKR